MSREIDRLVAEHVMGLRIYDREGMYGRAWNFDQDIFHDPNAHPAYGDELPHYSTDIAAAWEVVEGFHVPSLSFSLNRYHHSYGSWTADFGLGEVGAETAPLAICLAALKARGVNTGDS